VSCGASSLRKQYFQIQKGAFVKLVINRVFVLVGAILMASVAVLAQSSHVLRVRVSFPFVAGSATLPAGEYVVHQDENSGLITLQNADGKSAAAVLSSSGSTPLASQSAQLVFQKRNGKVVLTEIRTGSNPARMLTSSLTPAIR
jgi:hypothetical protein